MNEQDLRSVLEGLPEPVVIHRNGHVLWANHAAARCVGFERAAQIIGRHALEFVHPDDRGRLLRYHGPSGDILEEELRFVRHDGEVVIVEVAPSREILFEGTPARLVMGHDISERRRIQERLLLSDRMASLGTLAAGVAHEINNPLAYIYLNLEIAARELAALGDPRLARAEGALADALEGAARVRSIVGDLKTFARAGADPLGPVDVREVLDSAAGLAANELRRRARLIREYDHTPPAQGNRGRLGQVVLNLLLNAADAIPEGRPEDHEIRVRTLTDEAGRVVIEVSDTGAGIPEAHLGCIFDPFFTTKAPGKGTGLGLSICHHIVTRLGGEITAHSIEGKGSTFRVALPASTEALRDAAGRPYLPTGRSRPPRLAGRPSGGRVRVMIVDDEPALVRSLEIILGRHFQVVVAASSTAALHLLQRVDVDVILCDLMMAGMSGMQLCETLAATRPHLPSRMVFMTGGAYTDEAHAFLGMAQRRCLLKPFSERDVLDVVIQVAAAHRGARPGIAQTQPLEPAALVAEEPSG